MYRSAHYVLFVNYEDFQEAILRTADRFPEEEVYVLLRLRRGQSGARVVDRILPTPSFRSSPEQSGSSSSSERRASRFDPFSRARPFRTASSPSASPPRNPRNRSSTAFPPIEAADRSSGETGLARLANRTEVRSSPRRLPATRIHTASCSRACSRCHPKFDSLRRIRRFPSSPGLLLAHGPSVPGGKALRLTARRAVGNGLLPV